MKPKIQELIEELQQLKTRSPFQEVALGALKTARDNLNYHDQAAHATATPKVSPPEKK